MAAVGAGRPGRGPASCPGVPAQSNVKKVETGMRDAGARRAASIYLGHVCLWARRGHMVLEPRAAAGARVLQVYHDHGDHDPRTVLTTVCTCHMVRVYRLSTAVRYCRYCTRMVVSCNVFFAFGAFALKPSSYICRDAVVRTLNSTLGFKLTCTTCTFHRSDRAGLRTLVAIHVHIHVCTDCT